MVENNAAEKWPSTPPVFLPDGSSTAWENVTLSPITNVARLASSVAYTSMQTENSTNTTSLNQSPQLVEQLAAILVPILFGIIFCVGIVGNSLVITVMMKIYRHHGQGLTNTNRFLLNLAFSDVFFLIFCVPFHATVYTLITWPFGEFMCIFSTMCQQMTMIASIYTLVALSIDRFLAVVYATSARQIRTKRNAIRGLIFIWIASIGIAAPAAITRVYRVFQGHHLCLVNDRLKWKSWYKLSIFILGFVLPLMIITCCYVGLLLAMCKNARKSTVAKNKSNDDSRKRVTRIVITVVIVFTICWFPHHLTTLWVQFGEFKFTTTTYVLRLATHCMSYANSCINPLIYAFVSKKFRNDFKKAFTCQYIAEAVVSMKAASNRMVRSLGGTIRYAQSSVRRRRKRNSDARTTANNITADLESDSAKTTHVIQNKGALLLSPRSPVMSYSPAATKSSRVTIAENKMKIDNKDFVEEEPMLRHQPEFNSNDHCIEIDHKQRRITHWNKPHYEKTITGFQESEAIQGDLQSGQLETEEAIY